VLRDALMRYDRFGGCEDRTATDLNDDSLLDGEAAAAGKLALWFLCMLYFAVRLRNDTMGLVGVMAGLPQTSTSD
jgi:hypothetical protein